jgi:UDP-N-acetyl-D-glucosamine dehydrogenase
VNIAIIGQGYVGYALAIAASKSGHKVIGFDTNPKVLADIKVKNIQLNNYLPTNNEADIKDQDIYIIAVPTPLDEKNLPDLSYLNNACQLIGRSSVSGALVINESTSFPGTLREVVINEIAKVNKSKFLYAAAPERIDPANTKWSIKNTPRVIAGIDEQSTKAALDFYKSICDEVVVVSSPEVAESAKLFENTFRQVNIALVNEFAQITNALGISVYETLDAANTKPYGFMKFTPSAGVGGHCIPVDPTYLASVAEEHAAPATFIRRANDVNLEMSKYVVDRVQADNGGSLQGKSVLVVGVAYKPNVADVRETAAELVIEHLRGRGAVVSWHDDVVSTWRGERSAPLSGADIAIVVTKHDSVDEKAIVASAPYVFDTTGKIKDVKGL